ncbi:N-acetylmuramoyl-L-alanine amidase [Nocardiopsis akebiae]|uniref:N-acetylmuramoyl-L-alanine amidase n=1 Tax=Nocardiopsis akebiae TaxID=2831968 RepID=A0ABX8C655_9ACTN|nr:N-acetylmuramoyl-L-alanine amidase [Nocardiopsis akebiae]QUX28596.1 N-acetylmuramoyl-L-alanine amidase [Nocardiopsis akebiae]
MPRPSKYVSRSDLGWGSSPATRANPRSGLVIHYDSTDQGLAAKDHSACLKYWRDTRSFHTGPSRGWADIGYCVDEATEILTENGWRTVRQVSPGDVVLTLNHATGMSEWQPLQDVLVFPAMRRELVRMEGREHSSLTTPGHRWPVERYYRRTGTERGKNAGGTWARTGRSARGVSGRERLWATTDTLTYWDRIPLTAPCAHLPAEPKWSDHIVELVAWFWTEGHIKRQGRDRAPGTSVVIYQSAMRDPDRVARIRDALHGVFGPSCERFPRTGRSTDGVPRWREARNRQLSEFHLSSDAGGALLEHAPGRVPTHAFLRSLTREQLALFIEASLSGDGHGNRTNNSQSLSQKNRAAAEAFQFAAILAGYATSLRRRPPTSSTPYPMWKVELRRKTYVSPRTAAARQAKFTITREPHEGRIWCVRTPNSTWLARREGTVYFTGNSFMCCAHGYVIEGRGLYKTQAAQPGGNTSHYSVTLATGPTDAITPEQINAVRALRRWLMEPDTSIAGTVLGHRDFISTSCPGDKAYALVRDGTFEKPPGEITEVNDMLGLSIGSTGDAVKLLQLKVTRAGFGDALGSGGVDGDYGEATAEAVRLTREYVGSRALPGYGDKMTAHAVDQVEAAVIKRALAGSAAKAEAPAEEASPA